MVTVNESAIPERFKERERWLLWDQSNDTPRQPHWRGNFGISWNDPDEYHTFEEAIEAARERDSWGIGYVFKPDDDEYMLDIDSPFDDAGNPHDWFPGLQRFADAGAYMEWSPSGNGVHIPIEGEVPDWWRDSDVPDADHQGVDVLSNKFCTFTGAQLDESGDEVTDANAAPFLFHAYKNIRGESPRFKKDIAERQGGTGGGDLTEEQVEEALDHVDPNLHYNDWLRLGFAVYDWDSGNRGKRLFESWSRSNPKWEERRGQPHIDDIWDNDSPRGQVTVATLIHHAKEGGWEPPSSKPTPPENRDGIPNAPDGSDGSDSSDGSEDSGSSAGMWSYIRELYGADETKMARQRAASQLEDETAWMYVLESEVLWVYDESTGYFNPWGESHAATVLENRLGPHYTRTEKKEVIEKLRVRNKTHREALNARTRDDPLLCVGNGVINLRTGERVEHSPEYKFTRGLKWDYEPAAASPKPILQFLDSVTAREADRDTILDHLAHGLMPGHPYRALVIMYGDGSNGKTRVGKLLRGFVGDDNAASVELQDLTGDDSFATGALPGAFVNVGDDISVGEIRDTSIIKSLSGDGTMRANEKYEKMYDFENEAAMFFSANEPPRIREQTKAIDDRLYPIEMPYRFVDNPTEENERRKIPGIAESLINDDDPMRGLLLLAVKHAQDLIERNGEYSMPETPAERREMYEAASDPIKRFAIEYLEPATGNDIILKEDAYHAYTTMCTREGERSASDDVFKSKVGQLSSLPVESTRTRAMTPGDSRDHGWRHIKFSEDAKEFLDDHVLTRYFDESETQTEEPDSGRSSAFNVSKIADVTPADSYVCLEVDVVSVEYGSEDGKEPKYSGTFKDDSDMVDFVDFDGCEEFAKLQKGKTYRVQGIYLDETDRYGVQVKPNPDALMVEKIDRESSADRMNRDLNTAADGGDQEPVQLKERILKHIRTEYSDGDELSPSKIAGELSEDPERVKEAMKGLSENGRMLRPKHDGTDQFVVTA